MTDENKSPCFDVDTLLNAGQNMQLSGVNLLVQPPSGVSFVALLLAAKVQAPKNDCLVRHEQTPPCPLGRSLCLVVQFVESYSICDLPK